jgi:hypothetical protein
MSRPIKFRAWYVTGERMITVNEDGGYATVPSLAELFRLADINRYELMQFTGLQDKNGTPIYEGDIVRGSETNWIEPGEVKWYQSWCQFGVDWAWLSNQPMFARLEYEVIGNVYETPDLMNGPVEGITPSSPTTRD